MGQTKTTAAERKIGKITYIVRPAPSEKATDTLEKKAEGLSRKAQSR